MAQGNNNINFKLNFELGDRKVFNDLKAQFNEIRNLASDIDFGLSPADMQSTLTAVNTLEQALTRAYDPTLNTINIQKFNNILKESNLNAATLQKDLANVGAVGQQAFLKATAQLMQFNTATKQTNKFLDGLANSLFNTIKYTAFNAVLNNISGTVQHAYGYVKDLDRSLNDIRIVTNKSADDMAEFAVQANNAAKALAVTTEDYTQGSLIYYQQGLDDQTVQTLTDITAKTSNVTQQSMGTVSEQLTAVWNGYQVANQAAEEGMQVYEEYVDKMAAVGASTASNLEELSTAMSKVASAASSMGVGFDDLNAQIATIVSVTRQAPESVGTALKTIYARLGDLKVDGVDEFGTKLGEVSAQLQTMGINITDQMGNMRNMSDVIAEVAQKQDTWTSAQRQAAAVAMAGKRQYNNLIALFDSQDMYGKALETSMNAAGTLEKQQEIAMESLANKMDVLKATAEDLYDSLFDTDTIGDFVEMGTGVLQFLADFTDSVGGLNNILPMLFFSMTQLFSGQIANGIGTIVNNLRVANEQEKLMIENGNQLKLLFADSSLVQSLGQSSAASSSFEELKNYYNEMQQYQKVMTEEEKVQYNTILDTIKLIGEKKVALEQEEEVQRENSNALKIIDDELINNSKKVIELKEQATALSDIADQLSQNLKGDGLLLRDVDTNQFDSITKTFKDLGIELGNLEKNGATIDKINNRFKELVKEEGDAQRALERLTQEMRQVGNGVDGVVKLRQEVSTLSGSVENVRQAFKDGLDTKMLVQNITSVVSAVGQLGFAVNSFKNIGNIINDDNLSSIDKFSQILFNLSMTAPMIISSFQGISSGISEIGKAFTILKTIKETNMALEMANNVVLEKSNWLKLFSKSANNEATKALNEQIVAKILNKTITDEENLSLEINNASQGVNKKALEARKVSYLELIAAVSAQTAAEEANTVAVNANAAAQLKHPAVLIITGIVASIGLLIGAYSLLKNAEAEEAEEAMKARQERQSAYEEDRKNKRKEIEDNQELLDSYSELYNKYEQGITSKEELASKTEDLKDLLGEESIAVANLTENYEALNQEVKEYNKEQLYAKYTQNQEDIEKNREGIKNIGISFFDEEESYQTVSKEDFESFQKDVIKEEDILGDNGQQVDFIVDYESLSTDSLQKIVTWLYKQGDIDQGEFGDAIQYIRNIRDAEEDNEILDIEKLLQIKNIDNLEKYEDYNEVLVDTIQRLRGTKTYENENYNAVLEKAIELIGKTSVGNDQYEQRALATGTLVEKYEKDESEVNNFLSKLNDAEIKALLNNNELPKEQSELTQNIIDIIRQSAKDYTDRVSKEDYKSSSDVLSKIQTGKITSENALEDESYKNLINDLDVIKKAYPEITEEAEIVNKVQLIGTQEYNEALEKVQDKLYELSINKAVEDINEKITTAIEKLNKIDIKNPEAIESFKDTLDEILNAQYEIDVQIHTEADQEFTNLTNAFDNLDKAAAKIGENFIVAADDIRELNNAFPGIVDGLEYLANGTVKLNKDIVESAMAAAEAEAKADAEATIAKLKNQADLLRAKQKTYEKMANAALILAKGETATDEESADARATISAELENLKELNSQESANSQMNNAKEVADSSYINAEITGKNQESAFKQLADASYKAASVAIQNMNAVANKGGPLATGDFNAVQYTGTTGQSADASIIAATESNLTGKGTQDQNAIAEKYAQMADAAGAAANDIDGMIMQIGAKSIALDKDLGSIATGKGKVKDSKSGSGKNKDKDQKEQEDEFDRYWEIKKAIDAVDIALKKLDKDKQNLYGYELIDALKQENQLLEQQAANYNTLYEMQQQEAAELREQLGSMGLMFDASGAITNYAAATSAALQQYAAAIEQYNAGLMDETTLKVYEKSYENFKKLLDRYDKLYYTEMQQTQEKLDEIRRKELANNLKAWEVEIQIHLDKEKMKRDWNDFLKDIKQDFRKVFSDLTIDVKYDEKNFKSFINDVYTTTKAIGDVEAEIDKMMAGGESTMFESVSQAQEKLKELQEQLLDQGKSLRELYKQVQETYLKGIDQVKDQFEELMKRYERFNDELEFHKELIELLYGDKAYDLMDKYYETQIKNIEAQIDSLRKQADFQQSEFQKSYETAIKGGSKVDMDDFTTQTEDMKKAYENMIEAQGDLNDLVLEGVKILQNQYLNSINKIMDTMDKGIQGKDGFEGMKDNQEFMQKMADEYLDSVEGAVKIQTFANKMDMDKANASNLKAQQKIQAFREKEIKDLREKENLTQADIDLAEARYQIMLKEIALEDAQNNKTSMKLTRNEQGNQSYQYVADEDEVGQKEQDLLQSYGDLYKLADDSYNHSMELAFDLYEEMNEKIRAIYEEHKDDPELAYQLALEIQNQYLPQIEAAVSNSELYKQEAMWATAGVFQTVCDQDEIAYNTLTEEQKRLVDELKDKNFEDYNEMRTHLIDEFYPDLNAITEEVFKDMNINSQTTAAAVIGQQAKDPGSVKNEINKAISAMQGAIQEYEKELDKLQQIANMDFSKIGESIDNVSRKIDEMGGTTDRMVNNSSQYLDELRRALDAVADAWNSIINQILAAQQRIQEYLALAAQARAASNVPNYGGGGNGGALPGVNPQGGNGSNNNTKQSDIIKEKIISPTADGKQYTKYISEQGKVKIVRSDEGEDEHYRGELQPFKTGGYTGEQNGSDGRLAVLHQKELVLNADDTKNFLSGIGMIRDMTSLNGSISNAITNAVANMILSLGKTYAGIGTGSISHETESAPNVFNITAEFPNANDVNEIREAILSLPNLASQYIGRNTR